MSAKQLQRFLVFKHVDEDQGGSYEQQLIGNYEANVKDGFIQRLLSLDYLGLGGTVVDPKTKTH